MQSRRITHVVIHTLFGLGLLGLWVSAATAQLTDQTQTPNTAGRGIALSLTEQIGAGQGEDWTPETSRYLITRDPARAIRRGRQEVSSIGKTRSQLSGNLRGPVGLR